MRRLLDAFCKSFLLREGIIKKSIAYVKFTPYNFRFSETSSLRQGP